MCRQSVLVTEGGFTLLEAMFTMVIVLIGLLGTFTLLNSSVLMNGSTMDLSRATHFAQRRLESVRNTPFDGVWEKGNTAFLAASLAEDDARAEQEVSAIGLGAATWDRQVVPVPATTYGSGDSLKRVTVIVNFGSGDQQRSVQLVTYVSRAGLNRSARLTSL